MSKIRPKKPVWKPLENKKVAHTALGVFQVSKKGDRLWLATLNDAPFPVLFPSKQSARDAANVLFALKGQPKDLKVDWSPNTLGGESAAGLTAEIHIAKSDSIEGYFLLDGNDPAQFPFSDEQQASEACAQYITFVWFSLSDIT